MIYYKYLLYVLRALHTWLKLFHALNEKTNKTLPNPNFFCIIYLYHDFQIMQGHNYDICGRRNQLVCHRRAIEGAKKCCCCCCSFHKNQGAERIHAATWNAQAPKNPSSCSRESSAALFFPKMSHPFSRCKHIVHA